MTCAICRTPLLFLVGSMVLVGCGRPQEATCSAGVYAANLKASDFPDPLRIDNPLYPLVPGTVSRMTDDDGNVAEVTVTNDTKSILGITARVIHDKATAPDGKVLEDTWDWFAQDKDGNVWYLGEDTTAYSGTSSSKSGSWEAGVDCAEPGMIMVAKPAVGVKYRQEYRKGDAEDQAEILALDQSVTVPFGTFTGCLLTKEFTDLEPGSAENKYFCPGMGETFTIDMPASGPMTKEQLTSFVKGTP